MAKQIIHATPQAKQQLLALLQSRDNHCVGIRISVRSRGCTGRSYTMSFVHKPDPLDHVCILSPDLSIFVDPKALLFVIGTNLHYEKTDTAEGFVFQNPNEKGRCGCGESFYS